MARRLQADYRIDVNRPKDNETGRDWLSRVFSVALFSALILMAPTILVGFWGLMIGWPTTGALIGFVTGGIALAKIAPRRMFVYNPEWCGYVTQDTFGGGMVPYGPGLHASHWWEQRNAEGNYSLEVKTQEFSVSVITSTSTVTISGQYEYAIDLRFIELAIGVGVDVVKRGITAFIENFLTDEYDKDEAGEVKNKIEEMGTKLSNELMNENGRLASIRKKYGYRTVSVVVNKITLPQATQATRDAVAEATSLFQVIANLYGMSTEDLTKLLANGKITQADYQKMLTRAMAISDNRTNIDVKVVEGLEGNSAGAVAGMFDALSSKGGKK